MKKNHDFGFDPGAALAAGARVTAFIALVVALVPAHLVGMVIFPNDPFRLPRRFHRILIGILGFRIRVHGMMAATTPILFAANHASYLDIPVLGAIIPGAFVAKAEVARWPLFGILAKMQQTVFIERRAMRMREQKNGLRRRLESGQNLILFPEGTSSDGQHVLPFKSGLFAAIEDALPVTIQPISVVCTELDGLPLTRAWRPYYAWFGDMTLVGHLWNVFKLGRFTVDVVFHPPVSPAAFPDRKALAAHCRQQVAHGVELCLAGRHVVEGIAPPPAADVPKLADAL
ncbi:MAG: lysophospholipid acyltransferase family protein [Bdellovibrionales bacterium]